MLFRTVIFVLVIKSSLTTSKLIAVSIIRYDQQSQMTAQIFNRIRFIHNLQFEPKIRVKYLPVPLLTGGLFCLPCQSTSWSRQTFDITIPAKNVRAPTTSPPPHCVLNCTRNTQILTGSNVCRRNILVMVTGMDRHQRSVVYVNPEQLNSQERSAKKRSLYLICH